MVRLSVILPARSSQAAAIRSALQSLMRGTRLEPGCTGCQVWTNDDQDHPLHTLVYYEEQWATEQAMEHRVRADAFTKVLEVLEAADETPRVEFDFVSRHEGLEYVEAVRRGHG
jgi:quinol monooxygenase YgiN